jgi:hypothetical protein
MTQSLHIFRKDLHHFWRELALYVALLIAFACAVPQTWADAENANRLLMFFVFFLRTFFPVLWLFLIVRLVQEDALAGDRQFWITRPYSRFSLLGAKLLSIIGCIILPFVLMQCYLLSHAGIQPFSSSSGLFHNLLYLAIMYWLPFTVIGAATTTLPRAVMSAIGMLVAFFMIVGIGSSLFDLHVAPPLIEQAIAILLFFLFSAVLILQYLARRPAAARIVLILSPFVLGALIIMTPANLPAIDLDHYVAHIDVRR